MNSTEAIRNYKHDISGKFKDISMAINSLDENSFNDPDAHEIFHAVHEVILKMFKTSRDTIISKLNQQIELIVTDVEPNMSLAKLQVEGFIVRYSGNSNHFSYIFSKKENEGNHDDVIEILRLFLPFGKIRYELKKQN